MSRPEFNFPVCVMPFFAPPTPSPALPSGDGGEDVGKNRLLGGRWPPNSLFFPVFQPPRCRGVGRVKVGGVKTAKHRKE
jgi:hypothetical protein